MIEAEGDAIETELREPLEQPGTRPGPSHRRDRSVAGGAEVMHIE
jgi:hypothetical protein